MSVDNLDFSQAVKIVKRVIRQAPALYQGMLCVRIKRGAPTRKEGQPRPKTIRKFLNAEAIARGGDVSTPPRRFSPAISLPSPPWNIGV